MDFVALLFCGFCKACCGRGAARDKCNEAVYGGDVYGPYSACGFSICLIGMDKFRDGDLVCVACRMDDCDGDFVVPVQEKDGSKSDSVLNFPFCWTIMLSTDAGGFHCRRNRI